MRRYFSKTNEIFLYHYSAEKHNVLKTVEKQNKLTNEEKTKWDKIAHDSGRVGAYYQHISFFFEPIPIDIISSVFNNEHPVWYSGNVLYEHKVSIAGLGEFKYELVESPEVTEIYYNPKYDSYSDEKWINLKDKIIKENHYNGHETTSLLSAINKNIGSVREAYKQLPHRSNFEQIKTKYAATVPHLMVYPKTGAIEVSSISKVVIK